MHELQFDVYLSLQVKSRSMFDCVAFSFDLHDSKHVKPSELLISFCFKLSSIRGILLNIIDDHVKHVFEHVKLKRDRVVIYRGHNRTERGSAGSISFPRSHGNVDPAPPRSVLLSSEQLGFDYGNLLVNHAETVQLTAASEGDVLYVIGKYFRFR